MSAVGTGQHRLRRTIRRTVTFLVTYTTDTRESASDSFVRAFRLVVTRRSVRDVERKQIEVVQY